MDSIVLECSSHGDDWVYVDRYPNGRIDIRVEENDSVSEVCLSEEDTLRLAAFLTGVEYDG